MAQSDVFKRYLDAGAAFTQLTQKRAEAIVAEFVSAGELPAAQAAGAVQELVDRSRATTEALVKQVRDEVAAQIRSVGFATKADIDRLEKRIDAVTTGGVTKAPAKKAPAKKSSAKKAPAKKAAAKKATAKKSAPKR